MTKYALTEPAAAVLGIREELYDLYCNLCEGYEKAYLQLKAEGKKIIWPQDVDKKVRGRVSKRIDAFLGKATHLFTERFYRLHPNSTAMAAFSMLQVKKDPKKPLSLKISYLSFTAFLQEIEFLIIRILVFRKDGGVPDRIAEKKVDDRLRSLALKRESETVIYSIVPDVQTLITFKRLSATSCNRKEHHVVSGLAKVPMVGTQGSIFLPVHKCETCGRIFIGVETLKIYQKKFGRMAIKITPDQTASTEFIYKSESDLHRAGYNVIEGEYTEQERHELLLSFLKNGSFTAFQIRRDIENAIRIFDGNLRFEKAVSKWKSDLFFIAEYEKQQQLEQADAEILNE